MVCSLDVVFFAFAGELSSFLLCYCNQLIDQSNSLKLLRETVIALSACSYTGVMLLC